MGYQSDMTDMTSPSEQPDPLPDQPDQQSDQDAEFPGSGIDGPVHHGRACGRTGMNFAETVASPRDRRHSVRVTRRLWTTGLLALVSLLLLPIAPAQSSAYDASYAGATATRSAAATLSAQYFETRLFKRTNYRRVAHGCRPLRLNSSLALAAQRHTDLMAYQSNLSHRVAGEGDLVARDVAAGYTNWRILAENLAWGQPTPRAVFRAWVRSPEHRANLDNCRLRDVGFGVAITGGRPWVTADFGRHF
jgi:uncharacterized protein YkwD